jgi:hypothetical protein
MAQEEAHGVLVSIDEHVERLLGAVPDGRDQRSLVIVHGRA